MKRIRILFKNDFVKSVTILVTGTILSQLVVFLLSPIISRLYTPEDNADFAIFIRIVIFISTIVTARFESALVLPKKDEHAFSLYQLLILLIKYGFIISLPISFLIVFFFELSPNIDFVIVSVPFGFLLLAIMNIGNNLAIRFGEFKEISRIRMLNSISMNFANILFGCAGLAFKGLILGYVISVALPSMWFTRKFRLLSLKFIDFSNTKRKYVIGRKYLEFPKVMLPHALIDIFREMLIVFFILLYFDKNTLGSYDFSFKMLKLPLTVLGAAIGQVYFQNIAKKYNNGESLMYITFTTMRNLFLFSIVPFGLLFFIGDELFAFVFGENWRQAGEYSQIMAPWLMLNLIVSPISQLPMVLGKLKFFFWIGLVGSILLISVLNLPFFIGQQLTFNTVLKWINWTQFAFMLFVLVWMINLVKTQKKGLI